MSDVESLIPFLQQLVQRMRMTPPANEIALLQKATFKEMRPYFDAMTSGIPDTELYQMILKYLANPAGGTGLSGQPQSPPKPSAAPAPSSAAPTPAPVQSAPAPSGGNRQVRKIMEGVELHVVEERGPKWIFELATKGTNDLSTITMDFSASMNIDLSTEGPSKSTGPLTFSCNVPTVANTGGKELRAVIAIAKGAGNNVSLNYKVGIRSGGSSGATSAAPAEAPQAAGEEPDEVTKVADGLSVIVQSVETGYKLHGCNTHSTNTYSVTLDLGESSNLTFTAVAPATLDGVSKVVFTLGPKAGKVAVVDCNVKDYALGSCDIRYKVAARVA